MKDVGQLIIDYLKENQCEGLVNGDHECGCAIGEINPLDCLDLECRPAHKVMQVDPECVLHTGEEQYEYCYDCTAETGFCWQEGPPR